MPMARLLPRASVGNEGFSPGRARALVIGVILCEDLQPLGAPHFSCRPGVRERRDSSRVLRVRREDGAAAGRPEYVGERADREVNPYRTLGALLALELNASPPQFSPRRKRLRAAMRTRLADAFLANGDRLRDAEDGPGAAQRNSDS
jgi:hypothetical protein